MNTPLIVGITGGIGGGKSTLSAVLRDRGYYVYDTDTEARELQNTDSLIREKLIELFGDDIYTSDELDRKKLAAIVFNNPDKLAQLNKVVHPAVRKRFEDWMVKHRSEKVLFVESAIMFETGLAGKMDKVVVVTAPEHVRIDRVMKRDGVSEDEVRARIARQMPEDEKVKKADIVLSSDGENVLSNNVERLLDELQV